MKHYRLVIVGSGISSFFFLKGLDEKFYKDTCVLEGNHSAEKAFKQNYKTSFFLSNKFGGLATSWLAGYSQFKLKDLNNLSAKFKKRLYKSHQKLNSVYNAVYNKFFLSEKFKFNKIRSSNEIRVFDNQTLLFQNNILKARKFKNLIYLKSSLKSVKKINNKFHVYLNDKDKFITCDRLILACGTISTAGIISKLFRLKKVYFKHQLYLNGFAFFPFKSFIFQRFKFPSKSYEDIGKLFGGTFEYYGNFVKNKLTQILPIIKFKFVLFFFNFFFKRMIFFNSFINSKYCNAHIENNGEYFFINSSISNNTIKKFTLLIKKKLKKFFLTNYNKNFFLNVMSKKIGFDKHYYGIFFNNKNKKLKITSKSELVGIKNLFICDQSVININTSKFITYLSMANSYSLGNIISQYLKK